MRRWMWLAAAAALSAGTAGAADFNNEFDVGIFSLVVGNFNGRYERNLNDFAAVFGGAGFAPEGYLFIDVDQETLDAVEWTYANVNLGGKLYPLGTFRGLYLQLEVNGDFHNLKEKSSGATSSEFSLRPAMLIGWRWVIANRATLTVGGGSGYVSNNTLQVGATTVEFSRIRPRVDINLGFLF